MNKKTRVTKHLIAFFVVLMVMAAACGSGSDSTRLPAQETAAQAQPVLPTHPAASGESAPDAAGAAPTMAACREWLQAQSSLDYPRHGCTEYADILESAANSGAAVIPLNNSKFFIARFPDNWETLPDRKLVVALHGSGGCAERMYQWWDRPAADNNYALVTLQYAWQDETAEDGYAFAGAEQIYADLQTIFEEMSAYCPLEDTAVIYHGFSRGSARAFKVALLDRDRAGAPLFSAFIADSGTEFADTGGGIPAYLQEASANAYDGANFWLYCGGEDHDGQTCEGMKRMEPLLDERGAAVTTYRYASGGHGVFATVHPGGPPSEALNAMLSYINSIKP